MNVAEWFCLKPNRDNFSVDPERDDADFLGPPEQVVKQFVQKFDAGSTTYTSWAELAHSEDVVNAIKNLGNPNDDNWRAAWKWLTGLELTKDEPRLAKVTKVQIDSSVEYAEVLRAL